MKKSFQWKKKLMHKLYKKKNCQLDYYFWKALNDMWCIKDLD